jgi:hypothetical protein
MKLDSEQKKVLKAFWPACLGYVVGYPLLMWAFGKLDSWIDALTWLGIGLIGAVIIGAFYVIGSKIPKKGK